MVCDTYLLIMKIKRKPKWFWCFLCLTLKGTRRPNPWGLFDMHGNVVEWCNDYYSDDYYTIGPEKNPAGPDTGELRVIRGGAWNSTLEACRSGCRTGSASVDDGCLISDAIGFRCVRKISDK